MAYLSAGGDRSSYLRDMYSRASPQPNPVSVNDPAPPYQTHASRGTRGNSIIFAEADDGFLPRLPFQPPLSLSASPDTTLGLAWTRDGDQNRKLTQAAATSSASSNTPPTPPNPGVIGHSPSSAPPNRHSTGNWIHELSGDSQIKAGPSRGGENTAGRRASSMGGGFNAAPPTGLDQARPLSATPSWTESKKHLPLPSRWSPTTSGTGTGAVPNNTHRSSASHIPAPSPQPAPVPNVQHQPVHHPQARPSAARPSLNPNAQTSTSNSRGTKKRERSQPTPAGGLTTSASMPAVPTSATVGASVASVPGRSNTASATQGVPPAMPTYQRRSAPSVPAHIAELDATPTLSGGDSKAKPLTPSEARFVAIGIDFGTTYSGVSWVFSGDPTDIKDVAQYPSLGTTYKSRDEVQVPTQYDRRSGAWGFLLDKGHSPDKWFKLLLLREEDIRDDIRNSPYLQSARQKASQLGEDGVVDLVADFLGHLWQHAMREIELQIDQIHLQNLPFKVALTIPAIWPQYARNMMKDAARRAGILQRRDIADTTLILVEEPEAAALATLLDRREYPEMSVGETFMVVDCGGGTIDIISYKVMQTSPFVIREAVKGDGKLCGAFLVDDKFELYMRNKSGLRFENCDPADFRKFVYDEWETGIKRSFTNSDLQSEFYLHPPIKALSKMNRFKGNNKHVLKRSSIVGFFDETYQGIHQLIDDQNNKIIAQEGRSPKKIILVGGLGSSRYLSQRLQTEYGNVMQPQRPWSAVARGAVIKLLKNTFKREDVVSAADDHQLACLNGLPEMDVRIARYSYGVETGLPLHMAFPPVVLGIDRISREADGQQRVWRMQWYVKQGEVMDNREPVSYKFFEHVKNPARKQTEFLIYTSNQMPPPERRDANCQLLCTLFCDYDTPFSELPIIDEANGVRLVDNMHLTMSFEGEPEWRLQVGSKSAGRKVDEGRVDVRFA
ncbi:hypothetical protein SEPCBS119000_001954 [Sporothrix epigloea]|uniref:Hsp70 family chaperone n=1 Tax=Sporothrix epigloea TaxID=1892477 RepID=A0ABP0DDJ2_9PEZI